MIRQQLSGRVVSEQELAIFDRQGYSYAFTPTGAVINSITSQIICIIDGRYKLGNESYDSAKDAIVADYRLDDSHPNIVCSNFSNNPETTACSIRHGQHSTNVVSDHLNLFHALCVDQMRIVLDEST